MNALKIVSVCMLMIIGSVYSSEDFSLNLRTADITGTSPSTFTARDSIAIWLDLAVTAGNSLAKVQFYVYPNSDDVAVDYTAGATDAYIGSIAALATGYGTFQIVAPSGTFELSFNITYKKGNNWYNYTTTGVLTVGDDSGGQKRFAEPSEYDQRTPDVSLSPPEYAARVSIPTWEAVMVTAGTNLKNVSYLITPNSDDVAVNYPSTTGNYIGTINSGDTQDGSFQITAPMGTFILNINIQYRKTGLTWYNYNNNYTLTVGNDSSGEKRSLIINLDKELVKAERGTVDTSNSVASAGVGFGFLMGAAVGCVAVIASAGVIGAMIVILRKKEQVVV